MPTTTRTSSETPTQNPIKGQKNKAKAVTKVFRDVDDEGNDYKEDGLTFAQLFENSLASNPIAEGEVVLGKVVSIGTDSVLVDVGYKSEGEVPLNEFKSPQGEVDV